MLRTALVTVLTVTLCLVIAAPGLAKSKPAELEGRIVDEKGEVLAGVSVVVTSPEDPNFRIEGETNKKGKFKIRLEDPEHVYLYTITKDGHEPLITNLELQPGQKRSVDITLPAMDSEASRQRRAIEAYNEGVAAFNNGDTTTALERFESSAELDPEFLEPKVGLANAYLVAGDHTAALKAAEALMAVKEDHPEGRRVFLEAAIALGEEEQITRALGLVEGTPLAADGAVLVYNQAIRANQLGDSAAAEQGFARAAQLDPGLVPALQGLASLQYNRQAFAEAQATTEKLLEQQPEHSSALRLRYLSLLAQEQDAAAAEALDALATVDPTRAADERYQRADALFRAGEMESAKTELTKLLAIQPDHAEAHYTIGLCYLNTGDRPTARKHLERAAELAPGSQKGRDAKDMLQFIQ